uniref:RNA helicase n=1 Tax=Plectus sambesii TaxID=2011161 RepID=A0A914W7T4_9BILA
MAGRGNTAARSPQLFGLPASTAVGSASGFGSCSNASVPSTGYSLGGGGYGRGSAARRNRESGFTQSAFGTKNEAVNGASSTFGNGSGWKSSDTNGNGWNSSDVSGSNWNSSNANGGGWSSSKANDGGWNSSDVKGGGWPSTEGNESTWKSNDVNRGEWPTNNKPWDTTESAFSGFSVTTPTSNDSEYATEWKGTGGFGNAVSTSNAAKTTHDNHSSTTRSSNPQWSSNSFGFRANNGGNASTNSSDFGFRQPRAEQSGFTQASEEQLRSYLDATPGTATSSAFGENIAGGFGKSKFGGFDEVYASLSKLSPSERFKDAPPVIKSFYSEHPEVTAQSAEEVAALRKQKNNISVEDNSTEKNREVPKPIWKFEHAFGTYPEIMEEIKKHKFEEPSPIQCQAWPIALSGYDVIGIAQTGTGKTLAFLLPAFIHIENQAIPRSERVGPTVLVITPTRELALQIEREVKKYSYKGIRSVCVYGGGCRRSQVDICGLGVEIVIATPGRLNDLVQSGNVDLSSITYLVLDEADRMLDMGFEPQIRKILYDIRPDRHTLLTSATWPPIVRELAQQYTKDAFMVVVGSLDLNACANVEQLLEVVEEDEKRKRLLDFIREMRPTDKALVFVGRKRMADHLSSDLSRMGIECQALHGDRDQLDRERALHDLRKGRVRLLVATDVASRGLDVPDITHVFNYDFPNNIEEYVHRIGRTGRAGKFGKAITLMTRSDWRQAKEIIAILEKNNQNIPDELRQMASRFEAFVARMAAQGSDPNARPSYGSSRSRGSQRGDSNGFYDPFTGELIGTRADF